MLTATAAKTKWDAICTSCIKEVPLGNQADFAGKMNACILQLGIPAFKGLANTADRDILQAAAGSSKCTVVAPETIQMARQIADSQTPPIGVPAPPSVPSPSKAAAAGGSAIVPVVAIAAGVGVLWWLLKSSKKRGS